MNKIGQEMKSVLRWFHCALALLTVVACSSGCLSYGATRVPRGGPAIVLQDFVPSPDGQTVAFGFLARAANQHPNTGVGLLDVKSGKLTRIPNRPGKELVSPSFSLDGKRLVVSESRQLAIVDLTTMNVAEITPVGATAKTYPIFQPGTGNILYVDVAYASVPHNLRLLNVEDQSERVILDRQDGFVGALFRPSFVGPEEILFQAFGPVSSTRKAEVMNLVRTPNATIAYRLRFGESPDFSFPEIEKTRKLRSDSVLGSLSASIDGKIMAFIEPSVQEPLNARGQYNWEIFTLENGKATQRTNLRSLLSFARISADGSTVAFGSDPTRAGIFDLTVLDLRTGQVTVTGLLRRLQDNPDFALH